MTLTPDELSKVPAGERLAWISEIWDSLEAGDVPVSAEQKEELDARVAALESGSVRVRTWSEFSTELNARRQG